MKKSVGIIVLSGLSLLITEFLARWEKKYPDGKVTRAKEKASPETLEQLGSLGYIK
jgi:hypothetical protein